MQGAVIEETSQMMHQTPINAYCYNSKANCFVTSDEKALKLWSMEGEIRTVNLPQRTSYLIQTIEFIPSRNIYMASALDGTLRFYDDNIVELASIFPPRATILCLVFDEPRSRIISGGIDGCGAWLLRGKDTEGYDESHVMRNPAYQVAPLDLLSKTGTTWVRRMKLDDEGSRLLVLSENSIFVFNLLDGTLADTYKKLVKSKNGAVTDFLVFKKKSIIASCMDGSIYVITIYPRSTVAVFKEHTKTVTSLALDPVSGLLFSSSLDTSVRMWDVDLLRNVHHLRLDTPLVSLFLVPQTNPLIFVCQARQAMKALTLKHTLKEHSTLASSLAILIHLSAPGKCPRPPPKSSLPKVSRKTASMRVVAEALTEQRKPVSPSVVHEEHVVSICLDKSIRIFSGPEMITPSTIFVPEDAQDVVGFAFNAFRDFLYILMRKQILVFDVVEDIVSPAYVIDVDNRSVKSLAVCLEAPVFYTQPRKSQLASRRQLSSIVKSMRNDKPMEAWLVCGTDKGELLFSSTAHSTLDEATPQQAHPSAVTMLSFTSPSTLVSFGMDKSFGFWRVTPRVTRVGSMVVGDIPSCIQVAPTSQLLLCGYEDGRVDLVDFAQTEPVLHSSDINHAALVTAADFADTLHIVISTSFDMTIKVWDHEKNLLREVQMAAPLTSLCFANLRTGDVFVGMQAKMFSIAGVDILPAKLPAPRVSQEAPQRQEIRPPEVDTFATIRETVTQDVVQVHHGYCETETFVPGAEDTPQRQWSPTRVRRPPNVLTPDVVFYNPPILRHSPVKEPEVNLCPRPVSEDGASSDHERGAPFYDSRKLVKPPMPSSEAITRFKNRKDRMLHANRHGNSSPKPIPPTQQQQQLDTHRTVCCCF
ncbi:hypothetical protein AeRB84_005666 [Aphanomyces euteiches]|nr:hypothetical protein AeRB84_005666 [Aphanomyces euteiches]